MTNRLRFLAIALMAMLFVPASAMQQSDLPPRFNIPWGNSAVAPYIRTIPQASQIGIVNCAGSLNDGFPPLTFVPAGAGGCPPFGADFNGVLKQITQWSRWQAAGGPVFYDATLSTNMGGYPKGATVQSSVLVGRIWFSTADNNTTNPDATTSANWTVLPGTFSPGQLQQTMGAGAQPPNTVPANGLTIGNASSNATNRANADTYWLFVRIWTDCPNSICQLFNSSGGAITRAGDANTDFAANNAITTYQMNGRALIGSDTQGSVTLSNLVNVPVVAGSRTTSGSLLGENLHTVSITEMPSHNHGGITGSMNANASHAHNFNAYQPGGGPAGIGTGGVAQVLGVITSTTVATNTDHQHSVSAQGGGTAGNNVPQSFTTSNWLSL